MNKHVEIQLSVDNKITGVRTTYERKERNTDYGIINKKQRWLQNAAWRLENAD